MITPITTMRMTSVEFPLNYTSIPAPFRTSIPMTSKIISVEKSQSSDHTGRLVLLERSDNLPGTFRGITITPIWSGAVGPASTFHTIPGKFKGVISITRPPIQSASTVNLTLPPIPVINTAATTQPPAYSTSQWTVQFPSPPSPSTSLHVDYFYVFIVDPNEQEFQYDAIDSNFESSRASDVSQHVLF